MKQMMRVAAMGIAVGLALSAVAYGTLAGFAPTADGALYVTGLTGPVQKGTTAMRVTVTDAQNPGKLTRWAVYVDGDLDERLSAFVRNNTIVLDDRPGMCLIIR